MVGLPVVCPRQCQGVVSWCLLQSPDSYISPQLQPEQLDCGAAHLQHPLAIVNPITATPIFTYTGLTAVAVASVNNYTVVFLGTASGGLLKASGVQQLGHREPWWGMGRAVVLCHSTPLVAQGQQLWPGLSEPLPSFGREELTRCCLHPQSNVCCLVTRGWSLLVRAAMQRGGFDEPCAGSVIAQLLIIQF